jgi:hypothetical protein
MFTRRIASVLVIAVLALGAMALPAQAALRHIDGTVVSKDADNHSFRIMTQNGNRIRIKVTSGTDFERIAGGFAGLRKGLEVEVDAKTTANGLVATQVETRGGGGGDDGPNHT